tara:strand:+ start:35010 stop:37262 length:2253 start_codon:yes stop_codon:yes gene_type:complete
MTDPFALSDFDDAPPVGSVAPPVAPAYLDGLNPEQREAVVTTEGGVLVLAGAGTGKTRVLTTRFVHLLTTQKARSGEILAVTFTNKAAREMKDRIAGMLGRPIEGLWLGTFHSLSVRILRRHAERIGLKSNFTILDTDDQQRLLKQLMEAEGVDSKKWPAQNLMGVIQRWKDRGQGPDKVSDSTDGGEAADGRIARLYAQYQERLRTLNAADFGDLLLHCLTLFTEHTDVLEEYRHRFRYLLVDEYQDTNVAQYLWLRLLAGNKGNICCVGDDDQSIFSWRGAEVGNILRFEKDFPNPTVVRLERNYRSTPHILGAASAVIANNTDRLGKTLWTDIDDGEKVEIHSVWDGEEEARTVCDEIESLQRKKIPLSEMAVLVRAGFQTREFEERLITLGIPYRVIGGPRFYERMEVRDAIAYLRLVAQPDDDLAYERIINKPKRGLGPATMREVHMLARAKGVPLFEATRLIVETEELKPKARKTLSDLVENFLRWRSLLNGMPSGELAATVLEESGYTEMWQFDKSPEAPGRLENLKEFVSALDEFESIEGFLEHISLVMENDESGDIEKVTVMTLHAAKGLEYDTVFLVGWEEGLFPHQRALDESGVAGLEEERRLAYVGITRAKRLSKIFHAANRRIYNQWQSALPSRFIEELPEDHVTRMSGMGFKDRQTNSWGWNPAATRRPFAGKTIEASAWEVADRPKRQAAFDVGERVFHQKFGYGAVISVEDNRLEISFEKAGVKKVIDSFVEKP